VFERFTDRARRVLVLAQEEARLLNHSFIGTEHILLGLVHDGEGVAAKALESLGVTLTAVRLQVVEAIGLSDSPPSGSPPFTPRAKKVLELALREALQLGHSYIGTEHLLLGLVREGEGVAAQVLVSLGADLLQVRSVAIRLMGGGPGAVDAVEWKEGVRARVRPRRTVSPAATCALCGRDLWESAHFVTAGRVSICEACVRSASDLLESAKPEQRSLHMPPRVFGEAPDDDTLHEVVGALRSALSVSTQEKVRSTVVEDADRVAWMLVGLTGRLAAEPEDVRVVRVRFPTADTAEVRVEVSAVDGTQSLADGRVVRRDGHWVVSSDTVARLLGGTLPPVSSDD